MSLFSHRNRLDRLIAEVICEAFEEQIVLLLCAASTDLELN